MIRASTNSNQLSVKWDESIAEHGKDVIALSVADMDLCAPRAVIDAVAARAQQGAYGYTYVPESYSGLVREWLAQRHAWTIPAAAITYVPRVVQAVSVMIDELTRPGDGIVVHTPSYGPITNLIEPLGRRLITSPLRLVDGRYEIDFADTERHFANGAKVLFLCSPHNPTGRVWTRGELTKLAEIAHKYDALIMSDDVHADLVHTDANHIPIAALDQGTAQRTVTMTSPAKPFNLAGLEIANMIIENEKLRQQMREALSRRGFNNPSYFAVVALEAAYTQGGPWLHALHDHLTNHLAILRDFVARQLPAIRLIEPEGTYLAWLDCREWASDEAVLASWTRDARVALSLGTSFGHEYQGFARINLAVPEENLRTALDRLGAAYTRDTKENDQ